MTMAVMNDAFREGSISLGGTWMFAVLALSLVSILEREIRLR